MVLLALLRVADRHRWFTFTIKHHKSQHHERNDCNNDAKKKNRFLPTLLLTTKVRPRSLRCSGDLVQCFRFVAGSMRTWSSRLLPWHYVCSRYPLAVGDRLKLKSLKGSYFTEMASVAHSVHKLLVYCQAADTATGNSSITNMATCTLVSYKNAHLGSLEPADLVQGHNNAEAI